MVVSTKFRHFQVIMSVLVSINLGTVRTYIVLVSIKVRYFQVEMSFLVYIKLGHFR